MQLSHTTSFRKPRTVLATSGQGTTVIVPRNADDRTGLVRLDPRRILAPSASHQPQSAIATAHSEDIHRVVGSGREVADAGGIAIQRGHFAGVTAIALPLLHRLVVAYGQELLAGRPCDRRHQLGMRAGVHSHVETHVIPIQQPCNEVTRVQSGCGAQNARDPRFVLSAVF
eukprot:scaffold576_cov260-Pinguiococcus_pyrenoidosus.AAC.98